MSIIRPSPGCLRLPLLLATLGALQAADGRQDLLLEQWRFVRADQPLAQSSAGWEQVRVPHTWNAQDVLPLASTGKDAVHPPPYQGIGWYALELPRQASWAGKRVFLRCEAASLVARVFLNGRRLAEHQGGFTAFCVELTQGLDATGTNDLRIQVDNAYQADVPPLAGDFNLEGGLYRPVHLIITDDLCISPLDHGTLGVFIRQNALGDGKAEVAVRTLLSGPGTADLQIELLDRDGATVASTTIPGAGQGNHEAPLSIAAPRRWQGKADPYLYRCRVSVVRDGRVLDRTETAFGLRTVAITDAEGFLLNGLPYPVRGVNRHQEVQGKGWALEEEDHRRDFDLIADLGATAVRLTHYPQSAFVHDLCDQKGILAWDEVSLVNKTGDTPAFAANAEAQMRELALQLYNHPSSVFWGLYNEIREDFPRNAALLARVKAVATGIDPTRLIVGATCVASNPMHAVPDWNCRNRYPGWYGGKPGGLDALVTADAAELGHRTGISEYGAGGNPAHHTEDETAIPPHKGAFHPEEYQAYCHEKNWAAIADHPRLWGSFLWNMFDFTAAKRNEGGVAGLNDKGLISYDRTVRKDAFFFYKANWNPEPMVHLCSARYAVRGREIIQVKAYTTIGALRLTVNGETIGTVDPDRFHTIRWPGVKLRPGSNDIVVSGHHGGTVIQDQCAWTWDPSTR